MKLLTIKPPDTTVLAGLQQPLVDSIVKAARPDWIILLGVTVCCHHQESIFHAMKDAGQHVASCVLLVLLSDMGDKPYYEWQDKIESQSEALVPVTTIVQPVRSFEAWLKEGHPFAETVQERGFVIYRSENNALPEGMPADSTQWVKAREKLIADGLQKAGEFLAGAELFRLRKQPAMAAFMLHQSAEQALSSLLKAGTGYTARTHHIARLLRYAALVVPELATLFPERTLEEKRVITLLQKAYTDTRYQTDYRISTEDLLCITEKVRCISKFLAAAGKEVCHKPV